MTLHIEKILIPVHSPYTKKALSDLKDEAVSNTYQYMYWQLAVCHNVMKTL
jgi:hypothetical protein